MQQLCRLASRHLNLFTTIGILRFQPTMGDDSKRTTFDNSSELDNCPHTPAEDTETDIDTLSLTVTFHREALHLTLPLDATITDLSALIEADFDIPASNQKILVSPKPGLLRPPFADPGLPLAPLATRKITLLGSTASAIADLNTTIANARARAASRSAALQAGRRVKPARYIDSARAAGNAAYTFARIEPLAHLPNPPRSRALLERLANDPGIKSAMRTHRFGVGLLTEMDPRAHTTRESRTLGLNRNAGEVIELRLWTDDFEGYRDYRTIRRTLCHELAHNVFGEHDSNFWDLTHKIEREVERNDTASGGHSLGGDYSRSGTEIMEEDGDHIDGGGWTGGSYVLGGAGHASEGLSRRDILAKAAEERLKHGKPDDKSAGNSDGI